MAKGQVHTAIHTLDTVLKYGPYTGIAKDVYMGAGRNLDIVELPGGIEDFMGDTIDALGVWSTVTGTDGSLDKVAGSINGEATLDVGDGATSGDNEYGAIASGLEWEGDKKAVMACRIKISDITTVKVEVGFTDAISGDAGAVNVLATPSYTADDLAMWVIDTDDTATWQAVGVKATNGITKVEDSTIVAPVNDTYQTLIVELDDDAVRFSQLDLNQKMVYQSAWQQNGIEGGTNVTPWVFVQNRANAIDRLVTMDYIYCRQFRVDPD